MILSSVVLNAAIESLKHVLVLVKRYSCCLEPVVVNCEPG